MCDLTSPEVIKKILEESGFRFSKSLGQNFLIDRSILDKMTESAGIGKDTNVLEIGPGFGTLTQRLCRAAKKVAAVEIDSSVIPILEKNTREFDNLTIINADVLKTDLKAIIKENFGEERVVVAANLPYYITTPIIMRLLEDDLPVELITVMIQKEVARRIAAVPGTKDYGALTVAVNFSCCPEIVADVPPNAFIPRPKVSSSVIMLKMRDKPAVDVSDKDGYFKVVRAAFGQRRKTISNALANSGAFKRSKQEIAELLESVGVDGGRRGETLSLEEFARIAEKIL